ncbi:GL22724 [Drosophila persimilis]|uniref:GL22724 n=1 Tax=Drosophila persimilis TaxID=7234 RepID=B4GZU0_DROPE|nr:GL22724 [Drosophila persimilis]
MAKSTLYAAGVTCLGFVCFALASVAIGIPIWGYYDSPSGGYDFDRGYFGPFKVCKQLTYNREKCGNDVSKFRLSNAVFVSGLLAIGSSALLGIFCILSVIQHAMISSREKVVMPYTTLVIVKLIFSLLGGVLAIIATILFALQIDEQERFGFKISRGISFYIQIVAIVLSIALFVAALNGVSVTDASGKPYSGIRNGAGTAGSVASMSTTVTSVSNGSTLDSVTRSPLRSSLKKPRPRPDPTLGIQNPGYSGSGSSPPMRRNGSVKKVRIQTHSTEV